MGKLTNFAENLVGTLKQLTVFSFFRYILCIFTSSKIHNMGVLDDHLVYEIPLDNFFLVKLAQHNFLFRDTMTVDHANNSH